MSGPLMLLDLPSLYYRSFHGMAKADLRSPQGEPIGLLRGTVDTLARLVREHTPGRLVACLDHDWRPAFRVAAVPSYKAHRVADNGAEAEPPELAAQVLVLLDLLDALGVCVTGVDGYEADDVLGTLSLRGPGPVDVVTGDRDLFQLVDDARGVRVLYTVEKMKPYDEAAVSERYGIPGRLYAELAVLRGDPSDGLPGVKGVGEKTAAALVTRFGTVDDVVAALESGSDEGFPAGARRKLEDARDYLTVAPAVSRTVRDLPVPDLDDALPRAPRHPERLVALADRWGLDSSCERFLQALEVAHAAR